MILNSFNEYFGISPDITFSQLSNTPLLPGNILLENSVYHSIFNPSSTIINICRNLFNILIINCMFSFCSTNCDGGAIYIQTPGGLVLKNICVTDCFANSKTGQFIYASTNTGFQTYLYISIQNCSPDFSNTRYSSIYIYSRKFNF